MLQHELSPLAKKVFVYLSDYNDFVFHPLRHYLTGASEDDVIAALDELEDNNLAEFKYFASKEEGGIKPRKVYIDEVEGRKITP